MHWVRVCRDAVQTLGVAARKNHLVKKDMNNLREEHPKDEKWLAAIAKFELGNGNSRFLVPSIASPCLGVLTTARIS